MVTARLIKWFLIGLKTWLLFSADQYSHRELLKWLEDEIARLRCLIAESAKEAKDIMQEFVENYRELAFAAQRKAEEARLFKRQCTASIARHLIVFWEARKLGSLERPAQEPSMWPSIVALALLGVLAFMVLVAGAAHAEEAGQPSSVVIVCDRSSSSGNLACDERRVSAIFDAWAEIAAERHQGVFSVLVVGNNITDVESVYSESAPERFKPPLSVNKRAWKDAARARLGSMVLPSKGNASAILEALYATAFRLSGIPGEKRIVLMSDLRHIGGPFNFEQKVPAPADFLQHLQSLPDQPDFRGARLTVCGFHTASPGGHAIGVEYFLMLRQVWEAAFRQWGLHDVPIREECSF